MLVSVLQSVAGYHKVVVREGRVSNLGRVRTVIDCPGRLWTTWRLPAGAGCGAQAPTAGLFSLIAIDQLNTSSASPDY